MIDTDKAEQYQQRIKSQIDQYKNVEAMHTFLSDMHNYWKQKYVVPQMREVTESANYLDFYAQNFIRGMEETGNRVMSSLGSGDGLVEAQIAKCMKTKYGMTGFTLECVELSEFQLERAEKNAAKEGVSENIRLTQADFNLWTPDENRAGIMGHHALHHVMDLEHVFKTSKEALSDHGKFVTVDIIGRNGHMRWPETLEIVESIWAFLPPEKRYHHVFDKINEEYVNWDCSTQGFEGIRAQDILPLMMMNFEFETFFAYGGIIDAFINRGFGKNFDPNKEEDCRFVDFLQLLNELLIDLGHITPTVMFACASPQRTKELRVFKERTPEKCVRLSR